ncbi:MAG: Fic family protein [bacterium]
MSEYFPLTIPTPSFDSNITELIVGLEVLRGERPYLEVHPCLFFQLKDIFHMIESLQSARIEGNRTTFDDYVEAKFDNTKNQSIEEIDNIENAIKYIDEVFHSDKKTKITSVLIKELHTILTQGLTCEGSRTPGNYRKNEVKILNANHIPPMAIMVQEYMDELIAWINEDTKTQNKPLKIAVAHHRFTWIHPFDNGNGRMSRLLTYFMLRQYGYRMSDLMNLSAIFCIDRSKYFDNLEKADSGNDEDLLYWCEYVLSGLILEIKKIQKLLDKEFFITKILTPALNSSLKKGRISNDEKKILELSLRKTDNLIMIKDIKVILKDKNDRQLNTYINKMIKEELLQREKANSRKYLINLFNSSILRGIIKSLENEGLVNKYD